MKTIQLILYLVMISLSSSVVAQSKGEMPFTSSSPNANKLLRSAWVDLADFKIQEANSTIHQVLKEDPDCGMAYVSLFPSNNEERDENLVKAESMKLSAEEKMFVEGVKAGRENKSNKDYFEPLIKKYPSDYYLLLWIMFNNSDPERAIQISETIIKRKPKFAPAYNMLGYLYMNKNDMAKAEAHFDKYLSLRPDLANPYDSKADYFMRTGKFEEAISMYEKAASLGMTVSGARAESAKARLKYPEPSEKDANTIKQMMAGAFAAYQQENIDELLKNYSEQSLEILANQRVNVGVANMRQRVSEIFKNEPELKIDYNIEYIKGVGPIAVIYGKAESVVKENVSEKETAQKYNMIFVFRKQNDGNWKILANHFYGWNEDAPPISSDDRTSINKILAGWDAAPTLGEELSAKHFDAFSVQYSAQAVEIFQDQTSNIGLPNLRARWDQYAGAKMETNSLGVIGTEGLGRRAIAWGIGNQNFYLKDSKELIKLQFPWAMILTKENDDAWRILAFHWGAD